MALIKDAESSTLPGEGQGDLGEESVVLCEAGGAGGICRMTGNQGCHAHHGAIRTALGLSC